MLYILMFHIPFHWLETTWRVSGCTIHVWLHELTKRLMQIRLKNVKNHINTGHISIMSYIIIYTHTVNCGLVPCWSIDDAMHEIWTQQCLYTCQLKIKFVLTFTENDLTWSDTYWNLMIWHKLSYCIWFMCTACFACLYLSSSVLTNLGLKRIFKRIFDKYLYLQIFEYKFWFSNIRFKPITLNNMNHKNSCNLCVEVTFCIIMS